MVIDNSPMNPNLLQALKGLQAEGLAGPNHHSEIRARWAMLNALAARRERSWVARALGWLGRQPRLSAELAMVAVVAVGVLGWSAPAGTPFHGMRLARQTLTLSLAGENRLDTDLNFAEQSLADAARNEARQDSLAEARAFLNDAHALLPANENDVHWQRWQADETQLVALSVQPPAPITVRPPSVPVRQPSPQPIEMGSDRSENGSGGTGGDDTERPTPKPSPSASPQMSPQASPSASPDH